ncbi:phosphotransferase [Candidatus Vidania fulgoroideorum]
MGVFTKIKKKKFFNLLNLYKFNKLERIIETSSGTENTNYFLKIDSKWFVFTLFEEINKKELCYFIKLINRLYYKLNLIPKFIKNKNGKIVNKYKKYFLLSKKIKGINLKKPNKYICKILGKYLAKLHKLNFLKYERNKFHIKNLKKKIKILNLDKKLKNFIKNEFFYIKKNFKKVFKKTYSVGICHNDLFKDNVFINKSKKSVISIIDFYLSCTEKQIFDIAITICDWCFEKKFLKKKIIFFLNGYVSVKNIKKSEILLLPKIIRICSLRFLIERLYKNRLKASFKKKNPFIFLSIIKNIKKHKLRF